MQQKSCFSSTMRPPTSTNFPRISLRSTLSSSVECKEEELLYIDESAKTGEISKKRKVSATRACTKRQRSEETLNCTLLVKAYPNHSQKQLLKRWMGLARFAYNSVCSKMEQKMLFYKGRWHQKKDIYKTYESSTKTFFI